MEGSPAAYGEDTMKALVLVNGELYQPDVLRSRVHAEAFDMVLAADGGADHARTLGVTPDAVIGDMDSFSDSGQAGSNGVKLVSYPAEKDETDLELALLYAVEQGADRIVMIGVMGGRMDMTIANVLLLTHAGLRTCRIEIWHGEQTGWVIRPPGEDIRGDVGDTLSLIPLAGNADGVTTRGLKHPLDNGKLCTGPARGISNLLEEPSVHVGLADGLLLAVHTPGGT